MDRSFLQAYLEAFKTIEGWFSYDAALMFMAYNQLLASHGVEGDVLEIGVHHGLSTIAIAALRGRGRTLFAADLFEELQDLNVSRSGLGIRHIFEANIRRFYPDISFLRTISRASSELTSGELGNCFSFCHVDGGHSRRETYEDVSLCSQILQPGGLLALDDYFNPQYPGVCEGAVEFLVRHPGTLRPLAIGYNKVLLQKLPALCDLNQNFAQAFPSVPPKAVTMWDTPAFLFGPAFRSYFDLYTSTPERLVPLGAAGPRAIFRPETANFTLAREQKGSLDVAVTNTSSEAFPCGERVFGLSYHLLSSEGALLHHDNERTYMMTPMSPGDTRPIRLAVEAPEEQGEYRLEIDLVWEQVMWFKETGNATALVDLTVV